jgi:hypothetical protein
VIGLLVWDHPHIVGAILGRPPLLDRTGQDRHTRGPVNQRCCRLFDE